MCNAWATSPNSTIFGPADRQMEWRQVLWLQLTDEFEVVQVIRVDIGGRVDLKGVVVLVGVLKQAVHWVQHLRRRFLMESKTTTKNYLHGVTQKPPSPLPPKGKKRISHGCIPTPGNA